jgi:hypothetical protein
MRREAYDTPRFTQQRVAETEPQYIERKLAEERRGAPPDVVTETHNPGHGGEVVIYVEN